MSEERTSWTTWLLIGLLSFALIFLMYYKWRYGHPVLRHFSANTHDSDRTQIRRDIHVNFPTTSLRDCTIVARYQWLAPLAKSRRRIRG